MTTVKESLEYTVGTTHDMIEQSTDVKEIVELTEAQTAAGKIWSEIQKAENEKAKNDVEQKQKLKEMEIREKEIALRDKEIENERLKAQAEIEQARIAAEREIRVRWVGVGVSVISLVVGAMLGFKQKDEEENSYTKDPKTKQQAFDWLKFGRKNL